MSRNGILNVASCQFPMTADPGDNGKWVRKQMTEANKKKADVVHFPESALSGYPHAEKFTFKGYDWDALQEETEKIMRLAEELSQWVVLGSAHPLSGRKKPHNCLYVINPRGKIQDRYDKRFCTPGDLEHYSPGDHFVTFKVNGVTCGLLICYDMRFPELYREYRKLGVQLMFHSFHNAHSDKRGIWADIMPPSLRCRAATNLMWVSANNPSTKYQQWPSIMIQPDGNICGRQRRNRSGVMVCTVDTNREYYDAVGEDWKRAVRGKLNSGTLVNDPRSRDRKGL